MLENGFQQLQFLNVLFMRHKLLHGAAVLEMLTCSQTVKKFTEFSRTHRSLPCAHKPVTFHFHCQKNCLNDF